MTLRRIQGNSFQEFAGGYGRHQGAGTCCLPLGIPPPTNRGVEITKLYLTICIRYNYSVYMNGRNTSVISVRLPDETVKGLIKISRKLRLTVTDLLKPIIIEYTEGMLKENNKRVHRTTESVTPEKEWVNPPEPPETMSKEEVVNRINPEPRKVLKIGRNTTCPCGSGKKYKRCCGVNA